MDAELILMAAMTLAILWLGYRLRRAPPELAGEGRSPGSLELLQREVEAVRVGVDGRLVEGLQHSRDLSERLGRLEKATEQLERLGAEISELQQVFRGSANSRGAFAERMLEEALADVLPRDRFRLQYVYPVTGARVDAAVLLPEGRILPIDSKFPLDNFRRALAAEGDARARSAALGAFARDVKRHIDDIASKYLSPEDGALDIALMYLPSEPIVRELSRLFAGDGSLISYALKKGVVAVSPGSLHAYLSVIRVGLRGHGLQKSARAVLEHLLQLGADVGALRSELNTALKQCRHSLNNLGDAERVLSRLEDRMAVIGKLALEERPPARSLPIGE